MRTTLATTALLLAAGLAPGGGAAAQPVGEVVSVVNQVLGTPPAGATVPLAAGDPLVRRHQIETLAASSARMRLGEDGSLALGAETTILLDEGVVGRAGAPSRLALLLGSLRLRLGELFRGELEIDTPTAVIGIKGTDLRVDVYEGVTVVTVFEGVVTLLGKLTGEVVEVAAGQRSVVQGERPPSRPAEAELALAEAAAPGGAGRAPGLPTPPIPPSPGAPGAAPPAESPPAGIDRPPAGTDRPGAGPPSGPPPGTPSPGTDRPGSAPPPEAGAAITGCSPGGQAGEAICVCGRFPGDSAAALTLGGRPLTLLAAAPGRVEVQLPRELAPGQHVVTGDPRAGFSPNDRCPVGVLVLESEYKEHLKQGRATQLLLRVEGTRERVRIRLENLSPRIIRLKGGNDQVVTTSGGRRNQAKVRVKAIGDGRAQFRPRILGAASCPCGEAPPRTGEVGGGA